MQYKLQQLLAIRTLCSSPFLDPDTETVISERFMENIMRQAAEFLKIWDVFSSSRIQKGCHGELVIVARRILPDIDLVHETT